MKGPKNGVLRASLKTKNPNLGPACTLLISVGQPYHEAACFQATLDLINCLFSEVHIMVCDTLQRYSLALLHPEVKEREILEIAYDFGSEWISKNQAALDTLTIPYTVHRWQDWISDPSYPQLKNHILNLSKENTTFISLLEQEAREYQTRFMRFHPNIPPDMVINACKQYLQEESPVISGIWSQFGFKNILYPRKVIPLLSFTNQYFSEILQKPEITWLEYEFKRYSQNTPFQKTVYRSQ